MSCLVSVRQDAERSLRQRRGMRREGQLQYRFTLCPLSCVLTGFLSSGHLACRSQSAPLSRLFFSPTSNLFGSQPPSTSIAACATHECSRTRMGVCTPAIVQASRRNQDWPTTLWTEECGHHSPPGDGRLGWWDVSDETLGVTEQPFLLGIACVGTIPQHENHNLVIPNHFGNHVKNRANTLFCCFVGFVLTVLPGIKGNVGCVRVSVCVYMCMCVCCTPLLLQNLLQIPHFKEIGSENVQDL